MYPLSLIAIHFLTYPKTLTCKSSVCGGFILCKLFTFCLAHSSTDKKSALLPYYFKVAQDYGVSKVHIASEQRFKSGRLGLCPHMSTALFQTPYPHIAYGYYFHFFYRCSFYTRTPTVSGEVISDLV